MPQSPFSRMIQGHQPGSAVVPFTGSRSTSRYAGNRGMTAGVVDHALHEYAAQFIPWVVLLVMMAAGTALHAFIISTWSQVGTIFLIMLATLGMVWSVWTTNKRHDTTGLWHGIATVLFGGFWLALCTMTGFITVDPATDGLIQFDWWGSAYQLTPHGFTITSFVIGGIALASIWNVRISHWRRGMVFAEWMAQQKPEPTPMEQAGHAGATLTLRRVNQYRSEGTLRLAPGDTLESFQRDLPAVETAHGFPPGSMTISRRKGVTDARICDVTVMWDNPIADPIPWPGLQAGVKA